jgi:hypothetical protein
MTLLLNRNRSAFFDTVAGAWNFTNQFFFASNPAPTLATFF